MSTAKHALDASEEVTFTINFRKESHEITLPSSTTIQELKAQVEGITGIISANQKLMVKGTLRDDMSLLEAGIKSGAKVMLIGTPQAEIDKLNASKPLPQSQLSSKPVTVYKRSGGITTIHNVNEEGACFGGIRVLEGWPNADKAKALLQKLSVDPAIVAVMKKHKWQVGVLTELSPLQHTLLGFNKNKGDEISLRLRFENGFRQYDSIKKVLYHELAHMEVSEHNNEFKALNSLIKKECEAVGGGRRLDDRSVYYGRADSTEAEDEDMDEVDAGGVGHVLGSDPSVTTPTALGLSPAQAAAEAAMRRFTTVAPAITTTPKSTPSTTTILPPTTPMLPPTTPQQPQTIQVQPTPTQQQQSTAEFTTPVTTPMVPVTPYAPIKPPKPATTPATPITPTTYTHKNNNNTTNITNSSTTTSTNNTTSTNPETTCPICQKSFPASTTERALQQHVNSCLDNLN